MADENVEQGIEGEIALLGSTPSLGQFRIRIVDRESIYHHAAVQ